MKNQSPDKTPAPTDEDAARRVAPPPATKDEGAKPALTPEAEAEAKRAALTATPPSVPIVSVAPTTFTGQGKPQLNAAMAAELAIKEGKDVVSVVIPRAFQLTLKDGSSIAFRPGVQLVPAELMDHWYMKAHGVVRTKAT